MRENARGIREQEVGFPGTELYSKDERQTLYGKDFFGERTEIQEQLGQLRGLRKLTIVGTVDFSAAERVARAMRVKEVAVAWAIEEFYIALVRDDALEAANWVHEWREDGLLAMVLRL